MTVVPDAVTVADQMVCALAREIRVDDVLGVGLGTPLAVLAGLLARRTHAPSSHLLVGGAVDPDADFDAVLRGPAALAGHAVGYIAHLDTMGMAESQAMTVQILRPAQVDDRGAVNTSRIGPSGRPDRRLPGGLATADVFSLLPRIVLYHPDHSPRSLPARVDWVTGRPATKGHGSEYRSVGVMTLVTNLAVISHRGGRATLESVHPWSTPDEIVAETGFELVIRHDTGTTPPPSAGELKSLAALDPGARRSAEVRRSHDAKRGRR